MDALLKEAVTHLPKVCSWLLHLWAFQGALNFPWTLRQPSETGFIRKANPRLLQLILSKKMQFGVSVLGHNMKQVFLLNS